MLKAKKNGLDLFKIEKGYFIILPNDLKYLVEAFKNKSQNSKEPMRKLFLRKLLNKTMEMTIGEILNNGAIY